MCLCATVENRLLQQYIKCFDSCLGHNIYPVRIVIYPVYSIHTQHSFNCPHGKDRAGDAMSWLPESVRVILSEEGVKSEGKF